jgi:hypothetical protein
MNLIRLLFLISLFSSKGFVLFSQSGSDPEPSDYPAVNSSSLLLYSSFPALRYKFDYDGTFYAFDDNFSVGNVVFDGMVFRNILINLNCHLDELYFKSDSANIVILEKSKISSFEMKGNVFIHLNEGHVCDSMDYSPGFYRVLWDGGSRDIVFLEKISKNYREQFDKSSRYNEPDFLQREFVEESEYFVMKNGVVFSLNKPSDLCDILEVSKSDLRKLLREHNYSINTSNIDCYKILFNRLCD